MLINIIFTGLLLFAVNKYSNGRFVVESTKYDPYLTFGFLAIVLFICNTILKKILKIITLPLKWLTLGLFSLILNIIILYIFKIFINSGDFGMTIALGTTLQVLIFSFFLTLPGLLAKLFK